jgi:hypothetical protein
MNRSLSCVLALAGTLAGTLVFAACGDMTPGPTDPTSSDDDVTRALTPTRLGPPTIDFVRAKRPVDLFDFVIVGDGENGGGIADKPALRADAQVMHALLTFHTEQLALVEEVLPLLHATQASDFAHTIHDAHLAALNELRAVRADGDMLLEPSGLSLALRRASKNATDRLLEADKDDVDEMFIAQQLATYTRARDMLDNMLAPAAEQRVVQKLVDNARTLVEKQLELAMRLHLLAVDGGLHDDDAPM